MLYGNTGGAEWTDATGWGAGEPCVDSWYGVLCCPRTLPLLTATGCAARPEGGGGAEGRRRRRTQQIDDLIDSGWSGVRTPALDFPNGCSSGNTTGTEADLARCVIVGLNLQNNGLAGSVGADGLCALRDLQWLSLAGNPGLTTLDGADAEGGVSSAGSSTAGGDADCLPSLRVLDLSDASLGGALPGWLASAEMLSHLESLRLDGNRFDTPADWGGGSLASAAAGGESAIGVLSQQCLRPTLSCAGFPPESCSAVGPDFALRSDEPTACTYCDPAKRTMGLVLIVVTSLAFVGLLVVYIAFIRQSSMKKWVSTAALFISHLQTLAIVGNLRLSWPPAVEATTDLLSLSLAHASFLRPECYIDSSKSFIILSTVQVDTVLVTLLLTTALYAVPSRFSWGPRGLMRGRSFFVQTIIVSFTFSSSWRLALNLFLYNSAGIDAKVGAPLALNATAMVATQLCLIYKYAIDVFSLLAHRTDKLEGGGLVTVSPSSLLHRISNSGLGRFAARRVPLRDAELTRIVERRTRFLTGRYADHAPYWQFVKWSWMICLILDSMLANAILSAIADPASASHIAATLTHALAAIAILACAWRAHWRVHPYEFAMQNYVEHLLFFSDMLLVLFGTLYTLLLRLYPTCLSPLDPDPLNATSPPNSTASPMSGGACMAAPVRTLLEVVMMILLVGAVLVAVGFMVHAYCTGKMEVTQAQFDAQLDMRRGRGLSVLAALSVRRAMSFGVGGRKSRRASDRFSKVLDDGSNPPTTPSASRRARRERQSERSTNKKAVHDRMVTVDETDEVQSSGAGGSGGPAERRCAIQPQLFCSQI
jgi:hypothetical protein